MASPNVQLAEFEAVVLGNLSEHNEVRSAAEASLTAFRGAQPSQFMLALLALLKESQHPQAREFAAVILRQNLLINSSSPVWAGCSAEVRGQIQAGLLFLFMHEPSPSLRRKITDAVAATATRISGAPQKRITQDAKTGSLKHEVTEAPALTPDQLTPWPELMPMVLHLAQQNAPETRQSLCDLISKLAEFNSASLRQHIPACKTIIVGGMKDAATPTRLSALRACVSLLSELDEADREHMKDTVPLMFEILGSAYSQADEETIVHAVTALSNLADLNTEGSIGVGGGAKFLKNHIKPILSAMTQMISSQSLEGETRRVCFTFLLTLAEGGKGMIRKQGEFAAAVIPLAFAFLTELQHTAEWDDPLTIDEGDDDDGFDNYKFGREAMDRLANALGGKLFMTVATPLIARAAKDSNWNVRHAALVTLAKMANGCNKHLEPQLKTIMDTYVTAFALGDPHYRVRWAAVDLCAHLSEAFEPEFANDHAIAIFGTLLACMQPSNHWRVIANACLCLPDVCRGIEKEHLLPHLTPFLTALVPLLGMLNTTPKVVENALAAVSAMAGVAAEDFIPFYDAFMPGVKGLIMSCVGGDARQAAVRRKAVECMGMLAQAVGGDKFRPELAPIMEALLAMLAAPNLPSDDPLANEVATTMARICRSAKQEFAPYLPRVVPRLIVSASINDACVVVSEGEVNAYQGRAGWATSTVEVKQTGTQQVSFNSSLIEEKALAIRMLFEYCNTMGATFYPYAQEAAAILIPCVRYQWNLNVCENSTFSLPPLMRCVKDALANEPQKQVQQCTELLAFMWPKVVEAIQVEGDLDLLGDIIDALREVIEIFPVAVSQAQITEVNALIYRVVGEMLVRCRERDEQRGTEDYDDEQAELYAMENEAEDALLGHIYSLVNAFVKNARDAYLTDFHTQLHEIFSAMMQSDDVSLRTSGICVLSQVMEDCPDHPAAHGYCDLMFKICTASAEDEDVGLKQSAMFGFGVCAIVLRAKFAPMAVQIMQQLQRIISSNLGEDYAVATDNAISAMAKIFIHVFANGTAPGTPKVIIDIMGKWVHFLPCDGDLLESQKIHAMLCTFVGNNNPIVMGDGFSNLPIILGVFGKILARSDCEEVCLPATRDQIISIWQQLQAGMPQEQLHAMLRAMNADQRGAFAPYVVNKALLQGL